MFGYMACLLPGPCAKLERTVVPSLACIVQLKRGPKPTSNHYIVDCSVFAIPSLKQT